LMLVLITNDRRNTAKIRSSLMVLYDEEVLPLSDLPIASVAPTPLPAEAKSK
uniref:SLC12 domain-containing protein n=1 Tax=Heligmosomoides polygyrus TaxID=6339 RepID=A0A183FK33_HELPZ